MKKRNKYGDNRSYVIVHRDFILEELQKKRTIKSIWNDMVDSKNCNMPYKSFVYSLSTLFSRSEITGKTQQDKKENHQTKPVKNFDFNPQIDIEEII